MLPVHCGDQRHLGLCLGYIPALAFASCRLSDQGTTLRASDLHNARATILNPFIIVSLAIQNSSYIGAFVVSRSSIQFWVLWMPYCNTDHGDPVIIMWSACLVAGDPPLLGRNIGHMKENLRHRWVAIVLFCHVIHVDNGNVHCQSIMYCECNGRWIIYIESTMIALLFVDSRQQMAKGISLVKYKFNHDMQICWPDSGSPPIRMSDS